LTSANTSSAVATAANSNTVTQAAQQTQTGGSTQVGGSGQSQVVIQNAPTTQTATASAQSGSEATGQATSTQTGSKDVSQTAEQTQSGGGAQTQVIEQSTDEGTCELACLAIGVESGKWPSGSAGWVLAARAPFALAQRAHAWSPGVRVAGSASRRPAPVRHDVAPRVPQSPLPPQAPAALGAAVGGSSGSSLWIFGALLVPFFLTAPWWARRQRPSAVRRLMGVVFRLDRPG
jgi:hypothetical protein